MSWSSSSLFTYIILKITQFMPQLRYVSTYDVWRNNFCVSKNILKGLYSLAGETTLSKSFAFFWKAVKSSRKEFAP